MTHKIQSPIISKLRTFDILDSDARNCRYLRSFGEASKKFSFHQALYSGDEYFDYKCFDEFFWF